MCLFIFCVYIVHYKYRSPKIYIHSVQVLYLIYQRAKVVAPDAIYTC